VTKTSQTIRQQVLALYLVLVKDHNPMDAEQETLLGEALNEYLLETRGPDDITLAWWNFRTGTRR
jgi:hypothetical protein